MSTSEALILLNAKLKRDMEADALVGFAYMVFSLLLGWQIAGWRGALFAFTVSGWGHGASRIYTLRWLQRIVAEAEKALS
jgi:hypothetical protein